ncbi:hypothetical protein [Rhizobium sp. CSW-27]|uniref:hypothetical protein n=1 Tax=Rhizobium sp. CSW-27 TaxID=2839985 RepID=UPI001C032C06|nr:hypothetical protein [Rhizobium sp. CSW-27]MBT9371364.1 hypothetical protein [Rhizobium sp. CSW-27]
MTEKLELQPNEPLSVKVERHRAVYLAAVNGEGGADMDQEAKARMEIIGHAPSDQDERDQKLCRRVISVQAIVNSIRTSQIRRNNNLLK